MKKIKLMPDYFSYPLWHTGDTQEFGDIDPSTLPISEELRKRLLDWSDVFDAILNMDDPRLSRFKNPESEVAFREEGRLLLKDLQKELGEDYMVIWGYPY